MWYSPHRHAHRELIHGDAKFPETVGYNNPQKFAGGVEADGSPEAHVRDGGLTCR